MRLFRSIQARPVVATAFGVVVVAVVLLAVPISYVRTVGYEARLTLAAAGADMKQCDQIASEFAKVLNTKEFNYDRDEKQGATISARVPVRSRHVVEGLAMAYTQALAARGIHASSLVVPITKRITGNVYAAAANELIEIHINRDGKTSEQIEAEIRDQLAAAGMPGAEVHVTQDGNQVRMQMTWHAPEGSEPEQDKDIQFHFDGSQGQAGEQSRAAVKIHPDHQMTDAELKAEIERQLREQGKTADVDVENGQVKSIQIH